MAQNLTYSYLVAWIVGGLMLLTMVLLRTRRRPLSLSFAAMGFGAAGFLSLGLGVSPPDLTWVNAIVAGVVSGALGYGLQRLARAPEPTNVRVEALSSQVEPPT